MKTTKAIIEIPYGSKTKYELDKKTDKIMVDRFLHTAMYFPFNYGFIPNTLAEDGDPIDVLMLSMQSITPGSTIEIKIIGMLEMEDEAGIDTKLVGVPTQKIDPQFGSLETIEDVPTSTKNMIKHFFEHYKDLEEGKWVKTKDWLDSESAQKALEKDLERKEK